MAAVAAASADVSVVKGMPLKGLLWHAVRHMPKPDASSVHVAPVEQRDGGGTTLYLCNAVLRLKPDHARTDATIKDTVARVMNYTYDDIVVLPCTTPIGGDDGGHTIIVEYRGREILMSDMVDLTRSGQAFDKWGPISITPCTVACRIVEQVVLAPYGIVPVATFPNFYPLVWNYVNDLIEDLGDDKSVADFLPSAPTAAVDIHEIKRKCAELMNLIVPDLKTYALHSIHPKGAPELPGKPGLPGKHAASQLCLDSTLCML